MGKPCFMHDYHDFCVPEGWGVPYAYAEWCEKNDGKKKWTGAILAVVLDGLIRDEEIASIERGACPEPPQTKAVPE